LGGVFLTPEEPKSIPEIESYANQFNEITKEQVT
jgi:hypothetical protein